uniref:Ectoine hydroxylase-related dioxygenase, phytanoyl-CoA dioxygenase (PhyH) family n=1 Tax=Candidatus Kentrum sp. MB TaxID=2138164 RepID=A0A450XPA5_9GAMM|nr:MAG: Ectoine hydroxylase-related dioxygenase, phytanoyl-CoA dioxygenase (PhyH) family [Candidatus Kentron sp. MB]VFK30968.1 MAG: Ectoine hydroxylase-related dioxygenase, phytanoyl-CoA dioxygenase (PhyH) family [Candidatus Kentron sp. MB]VFK76807.1 MAG: Ectoine hydroxylase-related dioxygenase, phytanoyl-CoA dioxygenase (PhyH) family [Candidatus Kentron sp. MB]
MNQDIVKYRLTKDEKERFEENGYLSVPNTLPEEMVHRLTDIIDNHYEDALEKGETKSNMSYNKTAFISLDPLFLELVDWPVIFPKIGDILGWNIYLYHSQLSVSPPPIENVAGQIQQLPAQKDEKWPWHQDNGQLNEDLRLTPPPRVSIKVAYYLTDMSQPEKGNTYIVPKSHLATAQPAPTDQDNLLEGAIPFCCKSGTAMIFDQRMWHTVTPNYSDITRKVLFLAYGFRWLRPMDKMNTDHFSGLREPVRRQLLDLDVTYHNGISSHYWMTPNDVPLLSWFKEHPDKNPKI